MEKLTIPNEYGPMVINYQPPYSVICSVGNAPFSGTLDIKYMPGDVLLEFEAFERWLWSIALEPTTVEGLARQVYDLLRRVLGDIVSLSVTVHAETPVHGPASATIEFTLDDSGVV